MSRSSDGLSTTAVSVRLDAVERALDAATVEVVPVVVSTATPASLSDAAAADVAAAESLTVTSDTLTDTRELRTLVDELQEVIEYDRALRTLAERKSGIMVRADARALGAVTALSTTYRRSARLTNRQAVLAHDAHFQNDRYGCCRSVRADGTTGWVGTNPDTWRETGSATYRRLLQLELLRKVDAATGVTHD